MPNLQYPPLSQHALFVMLANEGTSCHMTASPLASATAGALSGNTILAALESDDTPALSWFGSMYVHLSSSFSRLLSALNPVSFATLSSTSISSSPACGISKLSPSAVNDAQWFCITVTVTVTGNLLNTKVLTLVS